jgi:hypothetical protein
MEVKDTLSWRKLFSGKFWLAIITGAVFVICSLGIFGVPVLSAEQITSVIMLVFVSYFNKQK